ncbi:epoxide hydrolase family protein [Streptomyces sp. NPDC001970]
MSKNSETRPAASGAPDGVHTPPEGNVRSFRVSVPEATVDRIQSRVKNAVWADRLGDGGWGYGASHDYLRDLAEYWTEKFDWRRAEAFLNRFPQYLASIEGFDIHFYHVKGSGSNPLPLVLTHGWPGSVFEFSKVIERLTHPERFGGKEEDAFDVVLPSLPGFGFSSKNLDQPVGPVTTARLWHKLMTEVLGYKTYGAQGGDLGSIVTVHLASTYPEDLVGIHLNIAHTGPVPEEEMTEEERQWAAEAGAFVDAELDYFRLQTKTPQTPSFALADSPLGTAAWILEKFKVWSDSGDDIESAFTKDELLTNLMIYLATNTVDSSLWYYRGLAMETGGSFSPGGKITVPTGIALFPAELLSGRPPRSIAERFYNITHWSEMGRGGHFAALEQPEPLAEDIRSFFRTVR